MQSRGGGIKLINTINSMYEYSKVQALPPGVVTVSPSRYGDRLSLSLGVVTDCPFLKVVVTDCPFTESFRALNTIRIQSSLGRSILRQGRIRTF